MHPAPAFRKRTALRALAGAAISACLVATIGLVSSAAAEPGGPMAAPDDATHAMHEAMAQHWSRHVQAHLDKLAERLEIKASQEAAWQKFSAAFRDNMSLHPMIDRAGPGDGSGTAEADAATLARLQAERAREHAQKLAQLAEATAALQQLLGPDQRLVFNEAARHFAREHGGHGGVGYMSEGRYHGGMGDHCERGPHGDMQGDDDHPHGHWEHGDDPHGGMMAPEREEGRSPGEAQH